MKQPLLAFVAATGAGLPAPPFGLVAFAALAAFTVWNALTILWADDQAIAWTGTAPLTVTRCAPKSIAFAVPFPASSR